MNFTQSHADKGTAETPPKANALAVLHSSLDHEWTTPQWLFDALNAEFGFTLDPCSTHENAKCAHHFTKEEDGLWQDWGDSVVFMKPPFGHAIAGWMRKAYESAKAGATVVRLIPARTDTAYWHQYAMKSEIRLLRGRLRFGDGKRVAPFPSAIVVMLPDRFRLVAPDPGERS